MPRKRTRTRTSIFASKHGKATDYGLWTVDCRLWIVDYELTDVEALKVETLHYLSSVVVPMI